MIAPEAHPPDAAVSSDPTLADLRRRNAELTEAIAARDRFIAVAAHELRNPMTPMIGLVELLLSSVRAGKYSPRQVEERLDQLRRVMNHYVKRAATLLDVSRLTSGQFILEPDPCDLCDGLLRGRRDIRRGCPLRGLHDRRRCAREPPGNLGPFGRGAGPRQSLCPTPSNTALVSRCTSALQRPAIRSASRSGITVPASPRPTGSASSLGSSARSDRMIAAAASAWDCGWSASS